MFKRIRGFFSKILKNSRGYIFIMMCAAVPLLLLGVKFCLDLINYHRTLLYCSNKKSHDRIVEQAVLEVACHWNPGLSLSQQKESLLRIADYIYNESTALIHKAIPGLEIKYATATASGVYDPLKIVWKIFNPNPELIKYRIVSRTISRCAFQHGGCQAFHRIMYGNAKDPKYLLKRDLSHQWVSEDMFWDIFPSVSNEYRSMSLTAHDEYIEHGAYSAVQAEERTSAIVNDTERVDPNDNRVQISVNNDKICVTVVDSHAFAVPAQCNVDIILAIPANGAACNKNNRDKNSIDVETPSCYVNSDALLSTMDMSALPEQAKTALGDVRATPIYQIAQACKTFLRKNFEFTRGVNVGLIPYSGKISIPPGRKTDWTATISPFNGDKFLNGAAESYIKGCFLYGTKGAVMADLAQIPGTSDINFYVNETQAEADPNTSDINDSSDSWGLCRDTLMGPCPQTSIFCRGTTVPSATYGDNFYCAGDLLSIVEPSDIATKFRRMNINLCYGGHANFLSMKCEKALDIKHTWKNGADNVIGGSFYLPLPYFLVELQPDIGKICDLLGVMGTFVDDYNVSNFLFIPVTWAHNLFKSWTNDPSDGTGDVDRLSIQPKNTTGRKKALILVVNKPDWFEPRELTYLGFDNDYSEIPMAESDCIRFDIDYSDASKKFADGTPYNMANADPLKNTKVGNDPLIAGSKKILKFETTSGSITYNTESKHYQTTAGETVITKFSFPEKGLIKIVVEPVGKMWDKRATLSNFIPSWWYNIRSSNDKLYAMAGSSGAILVSDDDGYTWTQWAVSLKTFTNLGSWAGFCCVNDQLCCIHQHSDAVATSSSGDMWTKWTQTPKNIFGGNDWWNGVCYDGERVYFIEHTRGVVATCKTDGSDWSSLSGSADNTGNGQWDNLSCDKGNLYAVEMASGRVAVYSKYTNTWTNWAKTGNQVIGRSGTWNGAWHDGESLYAIEKSGDVIISSNGNDWTKLPNIRESSGENVYTWICVCRKGKTIYAIDNDTGAVVAYDIIGKINFLNVSQMEKNNYILEAEKTFYIEPSQISDTKDESGNYSIQFDMKNVRLVSAEITNRPYEKITPSCSLSTSGNTATITTNVKAPLTLESKALIIQGTWYKESSAYPLSGIRTSGWHGISYGSDKYIAITTDGYVAISSDATDWILGNSSTYIGSGTWRDIEFGNGKFIAINESGDILVSINGDSWISPASITPLSGIRSNGWYGISYGNNLWLAITRDGYVATSADGINWTDRGHPLTEIGCYWTSGWSGVCYGNKTFMAINWAGEHGIVESTDGTSWVSTGSRAIFGIRDRGWGGLAYGDGIWMATSVDYAYAPFSTNDGRNFTNSESSLSVWHGSGWGRACYHDKKFTVLNKLGTVAVCPFTIDGDIIYTTPSNTSRTISISSNQTITISPDIHCYEPYNGGYRITLTLTNCEVSNAQMVDTDPVFQYEKLRLPAVSNESNPQQPPSTEPQTVDFSRQNNDGAPMCNGNITFISDPTVVFDMNLGYFVTPSSTAFVSCTFGNSGAPGDFYCLLEDIGAKPSLLFPRDASNSVGIAESGSYFTGMHRLYLPYGEFLPSSSALNLLNANDGGKYKLIMGGFTLPVNSILKSGVGAGDTAYGWYGDATDSHAACRNVTAAALAQLKTAYGDDIRIYIIEYRAQSNYKDPVTGNSCSFSYDYLNDNAYAVYTVDDPAGLDAKLQIIADNIKEWSGREPAKLCSQSLSVP